MSKILTLLWKAELLQNYFITGWEILQGEINFLPGQMC